MKGQVATALQITSSAANPAVTGIDIWRIIQGNKYGPDNIYPVPRIASTDSLARSQQYLKLRRYADMEYPQIFQQYLHIHLENNRHGILSLTVTQNLEGEGVQAIW